MVHCLRTASSSRESGEKWSQEDSLFISQTPVPFRFCLVVPNPHVCYAPSVEGGIWRDWGKVLHFAPQRSHSAVGKTQTHAGALARKVHGWRRPRPRWRVYGNTVWGEHLGGTLKRTRCGAQSAHKHAEDWDALVYQHHCRSSNIKARRYPLQVFTVPSVFC